MKQELNIEQIIETEVQKRVSDWLKKFQSKSTRQKSLEKTKATSLNGTAMKVFQTVKNNPNALSRAEIATFSGLRLSSVCARVSELLKSGHFYVSGTTWDYESEREVETIAVK